MAALDYLRRAGLAVEANGDRLRLRPADRITDAERQFVCDHRTELLAELSAANEPRSRVWRITRDGKLCVMIGDPMTYTEALEAARWRWPDAQVQR